MTPQLTSHTTLLSIFRSKKSSSQKVSTAFILDKSEHVTLEVSTQAGSEQDALELAHQLKAMYEYVMSIIAGED